jgi:hypothetical protein
VQAVIALFHLVLAFGHFWVDKAVQFVQTCIQLGFDLFRGVTGFIIGASGSIGGTTGGRERKLKQHFCSQLLSIVDPCWRVLLVV